MVLLRYGMVKAEEDWWATIYAAHFLLEARKAGFDVDNSLMETMLNYISNRLKNKETITYYYNRTRIERSHRKKWLMVYMYWHWPAAPIFRR